MALAESPQLEQPEPEITMGTRIRQERRKKKLDQTELGELVGVSRQLIGQWENDKSVPDVMEAQRLARIFECSFGWLCGVSLRSRCCCANPQVDGGVCVSCGGTVLRQVEAEDGQRELPFATDYPALSVV